MYILTFINDVCRILRWTNMAKGHQLNLHLQHIRDMFQQLGMAVLLQMLQTMGQVFLSLWFDMMRYSPIFLLLHSHWSQVKSLYFSLHVSNVNFMLRSVFFHRHFLCSFIESQWPQLPSAIASPGASFRSLKKRTWGLQSLQQADGPILRLIPSLEELGCLGGSTVGSKRGPIFWDSWVGWYHFDTVL
jgi:hypothetical protein